MSFNKLFEKPSAPREATKFDIDILAGVNKNYTLDIDSYDAKPVLEPLGKSIFADFYGIELEVTVSVHSSAIFGRMVYQTSQVLNHLSVKNKESKFAILKRDGSITYGFEICTRPASIENHFDVWSLFFRNKPEHLGVDTSCGMHVHISKIDEDGEPVLTALQIGKVVKFINCLENREFVEFIGGRKNGKYNVFNERLKLTDCKRASNFAHYSALNILNSKTIEIRIFQSTLDEGRFMANLEFCNALVKFCGPCSGASISGLTPSNFCSFVARNSKRWPNLHSLLHIKNADIVSKILAKSANKYLTNSNLQVI